MGTATETVGVRFDFVADDQLRESLESDYRELLVGMAGKAWKTVHVLAGSIVEALLIDWLQANGVERHGKRTLLEMDLGDAVEACKVKSLITPRAEQLTSVVRGYRNLIHPGRVIRTNDVVDQSGAEVAKALVEMIAKDIAKTKAEKYGYTAEQLVNKIVDDSSAVWVLSHLLKDMKGSEKRRLLLKHIPERYQQMKVELSSGRDLSPHNVGYYTSALKHLSYCFRTTLDECTDDDCRRNVAAKYVELLKTGTAIEREAYEEAFFVAGDLFYYPDEDRELIIDHLLSRLLNGKPRPAMYQGILFFLTTSRDVTRFVAPMLGVITGNRVLPADYYETLRSELACISNGETNTRVGSLLTKEQERYANTPDIADRIQTLLIELENDIPF